MCIRQRKLAIVNAKTASIPQTILIVTGVSGAGKTTVLKALEDLGWEAVDNFPIRLAGQLLEIPVNGRQASPDIPIALGFDSRTRGFDAETLIQQIKQLQAQPLGDPAQQTAGTHPTPVQHPSPCKTLTPCA